MPVDSWHGLRVGDQIGNLEYVVDDEALVEYRRVVGTGGCFPNLMAEDCRALLSRRETEEPLSTVWRRLDFMRPPITGRRVQVGGWIREVEETCGRTWIRVAAFAVDDIGTEILRSEAAFVVGRETAQVEPVVERAGSKPISMRLAGSRAGDSGHLGKLRVPQRDRLDGYFGIGKAMAGTEMGADGNGLTSITAGWLEGLLGHDFGQDFRWGGRLLIAYHRPVAPGMELRCDGVVIGHDTDTTSVQRRQVAMSIRDADDLRVATAEVVVKSPSPRLA